jgi:hypothetical protein
MIYEHCERKEHLKPNVAEMERESSWVAGIRADQELEWGGED